MLAIQGSAWPICEHGLGTPQCCVIRAAAMCVFNGIDYSNQDNRKCMCMVLSGWCMGLTGSETCVVSSSFEYHAPTGYNGKHRREQEHGR